jgi:Tfp pilus assembly protein PilE
MRPDTTRPTKKSPLLIALLVIAAGGVCVCFTGIGAAIAVPSMIKYVKRSKTSEAYTNVQALSHAVLRVCRTENHVAITALPIPSTPSSFKQMGDFANDVGFVKLAFDPAAPVYYSYAVETRSDGTYVISAEGDLDDDRTRSRFEITCSSACTCNPITMENELE